VIVALSPTDGGIRAMASRDDDDPLGSAAGTVLATQALRQPGSTFKALVLATALAEGHTLDERFPGGSSVAIRGEPGQAPWRVDNYDGRDPGAVTLATATTQSVNTVFARLVADVGPEAVARTAQAAWVRRR
jgi:penicillin-binding protein 1A